MSGANEDAAVSGADRQLNRQKEGSDRLGGEDRGESVIVSTYK